MKKIAMIMDNCVACGTCVLECPMKAISIYKGIKAVVSEKCVGCSKCSKVCPANAIKMVDKENLDEKMA